MDGIVYALSVLCVIDARMSLFEFNAYSGVYDAWWAVYLQRDYRPAGRNLPIGCILLAKCNIKLFLCVWLLNRNSVYFREGRIVYVPNKYNTYSMYKNDSMVLCLNGNTNWFSNTRLWENFIWKCINWFCMSHANIRIICSLCLILK